jgi:gamma-butyrobetaine dioxygenase
MTEEESVSSFSWLPERLTLARRDGAMVELPAFWLRDNCPEDRDPLSGQRLVDICDVPSGARIESVSAAAQGLQVSWLGEGRISTFAWQWLSGAVGRKVAASRPESQRHAWLEGAGLEAGRDFAWLAFDELLTDRAARLRWLTRLVQDGLAFLRAVPCRQECILEAVAPMGRVVETNYGRHFDVRAVAQAENLAYTDLGLGLHTDNPYRDPVPGFQALHCLVASPEGGESFFADGFALAEHLRATDPASFEALTRTSVPFHYRSDDADLWAMHPLLELDLHGEVRLVRYNNRSIAPLPPDTPQLEAFYDAYRRFANLLQNDRFQVRAKLEDGDLVVFDNHRTLHGRTGYTSNRHPRHLQGCYLARDSVLSETALLRRQLSRDPLP